MIASDPSEQPSACLPCKFPLGPVPRLVCWRARLRSRTSIITYLTRRATTRRDGARSVRLDQTSRGDLRTTMPLHRARSPIATRFFDVHLGFSRTSVVIDLTRRAARGGAHQLDLIGIVAILARRRRRTRARSLCALLCASVMRALDDGTDRGACFARQVASRQLAYTNWLPLSQLPGWAWTKPLN